ncbi:MAG: type IV pilus assembly protein PilY1, partial [Candidatus Azotimanducaceae bacterium]
LKTKVTGVDNTHIDGLGCNPSDPLCDPGPLDPQPDELYFFFSSAITVNGQLIPPFETDGSFNYRPSATFSGSDSFLFDVCETAIPTVDTCIFDVISTIVVASIDGAPAGLSDDVVEVDFDLAQIPLELPVGPEANVLVVNDDSGSMAWDILTDQNSGLYFFSTGNYIYYTMKATAGSSTYVAPSEEAAPNQGLWRLRNSVYNKVYYSPGVRYEAWNGLSPDADGSGNFLVFPPSDATSALHNPMSSGGSQTNLRFPQDYTGRAVITTPESCETRCAWFWRGSCRSTYESCSGGTGFQQVTTNNLYLPRYYIWDDKNGNGLLEQVPSPDLDSANSEGILVEIRPAGESGGYPIAGSGLYPKTDGRSDCVTNSDSCTYQEELQNFANWFTYSRNREFTAKSALGKVVAASENIRIGYAKLNSSADLKQITTMNTSERTGAKADLLTAIYLTQSSGGTPLRRSLRDAGRHFECRSNDIFNSGSNSSPGDAGCPVLESPGGNCQQNFTLLISDGAWNGGGPGVGSTDSDNNTNFDGGVYAGSTSGTLADVAMEYYERDLHASLVNEVPTSGRDTDGAAIDAFENAGNEIMHQHMKTFTVGFGVNGLIEDADVPADYTESFTWGNPTTTERKIDDMRHAAVNGRGQYLSAGDASSLADALLSAFEEFQQGSGAASAVSFNSQEIQEDTLVFRSFYNTKNNTGELIAQEIESDGSVVEEPAWSAAEQLDLITYLDREIITFDRDPLSVDYGTGIPFRPLSLNDNQRAAFIPDSSAPQAQQDLEVNVRVNYLRGQDDNERPNGNLRERPGIEGRLGDIVHSAPTFIGPPSRQGRDSTPFPQGSLYSDFRTSNELRKPMVYVGANDGLLHGFDAATGNELIAYLPDNLMTNTYSRKVTELLNYEYSHKYFVDSTPAVNDVYIDADGDGDKEWRTILVSGQGEGAKAYFALDITDPTKFDETTADQVTLWEFTDNDDTYPTDSSGDPLLTPSPDFDQRQDLLSPSKPVKDLGYSFSVPTVAMSNIVDPDGENKWVAIAGNGYNSTAGIAKLFILYLDGGVDSVWCHPDMIHTPVLDGVLPSDCVGKQDFIKLDTGFGVQSGVPNGLGEPRAIDTDGNGTVDYVYAGDMQGNFFRFDLTDADPSNWTTTKIFKAQYKPGTVDETDQPITKQPIAIIHPTEEEGFIIIFGSGAYLRNGDSTDPAIQSIYGIWDRLGPELILKSELQTQSYTNISDPLGLVRTLSDNAVDYSIVGGQKGWFIDLDPPAPGFPDGSPAQFPGEKAVRNIQLRGGLAFVNSIFPRGLNSCVGTAGGATLSFCPNTGGSLCFGNRTIFDLNNYGGFDDNDDVDTDKTAAGIILTDPAPPTDSTFIGDKRVTQYGRELHIIGTNTSSGNNTGRLSWKMLDRTQ